MIPRIDPKIKIGMSKPGIASLPIRTDIKDVLVLPVSSNAVAEMLCNPSEYRDELHIKIYLFYDTLPRSGYESLMLNQL